MARYRFLILQVVLISALAALYLNGPLQSALAGDSHWYVLAVAAIGCAGLILTAFGRIEDAARVQDILPIIAVVAMQVGILGALAVVGQSLMSSGDPAKAVGGFLAAISVALYVSVAALCSYLWLKLTLWLAHGQ